MQSKTTNLDLLQLEAALFDMPVSDDLFTSLKQSAIADSDINELMYQYHLSRNDYPNAIPFLKQADTFNDSYAQLCLASLYQQGKHCVKDEQTASMLFEKAAKNGESEAQYELAINLLFNDKAAADEDIEQAVYWLNESSLNGNDDAKNLLATLN